MKSEIGNEANAAPQGSGPDITQLLLLPEAQPRFYNFRVGDFECTTLSDGGIPVPKPLMTGEATVGPAEFVLLPLSCLLVRMPVSGKVVLIDTGFGPKPKRGGLPLPTAGHTLESLAMIDLEPDDIDFVLVSHLHPDHVNGMYRDDGVKIYRNAAYFAPAEEVAFWGQDNLDLSAYPTPEPIKNDMIVAARRLLGFVGNSLKTFRAGDEVVPGISTIALPGHTPTQAGFILSSGGEKLLYTADAFAVSNSVEKPELPSLYDLDPALAAGTRGKLIKLLAEPGWRSFTPHFQWPSVGRVKMKDGRAAWLRSM